MVYIKKADSISDFLRCIGAHESLMNFENSRISRDFKNSLTRLDNCELANEVKVITAARKQLELIEEVERRNLHHQLKASHIEVIELRKQFPESSLLELTDEYYKLYGKTITKSGLNHRFNRIGEIVNDK